MVNETITNNFEKQKLITSYVKLKSCSENLDSKKSNLNENGIGNEGSTIDLVRQILNLASNVYQDEDNISKLFNVYNKILSNSTSENFKNSIKNSQEAFEDPKKVLNQVKLLENNNQDSFLTVPLLLKTHAFCCVFRKIDKVYSASIINKGDREKYRRSFEEHIINPNKIDELIEVLNKSKNKVSTEKMYKIFDKYCFANYLLNIISSSQKTGNCFIKEPEIAIKYVVSTRNFSIKELKELRMPNNRFFQPNKVTALKPKWNVSNAEIHRRFVEVIIYMVLLRC